MAVVIIALVSQKGGVGKSTLSRLIVREYANAGWSVKIADLDVGQSTSFHWQGRRLQNEVNPIIPVERFGTVDQALKFTAALDLLILDAPPNSNSATLKLPRPQMRSSLRLAFPLMICSPPFGIVPIHRSCVWYTRPFPELRSVTVTPGTKAAEESVTVPSTVPVFDT